MAFTARLLFRVIYRSIYSLLYIILLGLLLITPADSIERSLRNKQNYNVWIVAVCYIVTVSLLGFVYALRLYVNKTVLNSIPKAWIPVDKGDVAKAVYKMVAAGLNRSAVIAYEARPRVQTGGDDDGSSQELGNGHGRMKLGFKKSKTIAEELGVALPPHRAVWGRIEHNGWSSPNSRDLPNLQYTTVLSELPNLIEARALMLAPPDPTTPAQAGDLPMLDPDAAGLLQRGPAMALRDYLEHLSDLGILPMNATTSDFLKQYDNARFSTRPISNASFREIMHLFAEILRSMQPLDLDAAASFISVGPDDDWASFESNPHEDASPMHLTRSITTSTHGSVRRPFRDSSANTWKSQYRTAPNSPKGKHAAAPGVGAISRKSSTQSFAHTRRPYPVSQPSSASLRSRMTAGSSSLGSSGGSSDSGSVIRLATRDDPGDLPYVLSPGNSLGD